MSGIRQQLAPFHGGERGITGSTVISDGATIDSLTVMDMIMALEDRFEIYLPLNRVADIHTVDQLAQAVLDLCARR
ncbi:MAG: acyl carrier protein [Proteobacteria bacterium]|nr:acyl carrier protein [Pseudomonadota bacterium]